MHTKCLLDQHTVICIIIGIFSSALFLAIYLRDAWMHRIDIALVKAELAAAGFVLEAESDVLRNPADDRSKPFYDESFRGKSTDRFVLRFKKKAE